MVQSLTSNPSSSQGHINISLLLDNWYLSLLYVQLICCPYLYPCMISSLLLPHFFVVRNIHKLFLPEFPPFLLCKGSIVLKCGLSYVTTIISLTQETRPKSIPKFLWVLSETLCPGAQTWESSSRALGSPVSDPYA